MPVKARFADEAALDAFLPFDHRMKAGSYLPWFLNLSLISS